MGDRMWSGDWSALLAYSSESVKYSLNMRNKEKVVELHFKLNFILKSVFNKVKNSIDKQTEPGWRHSIVARLVWAKSKCGPTCTDVMLMYVKNSRDSEAVVSDSAVRWLH